MQKNRIILFIAFLMVVFFGFLYLKTPDKNTDTLNENTEKTEEIAEKNITIKISDKNHEITIEENSKLYDVMKKMSDDGIISLEATDYGEMGYFITKINNIANDNDAGKYWTYYINSKPAQVGVSAYIVKEGDLIEWKYEESMF